MRKLFINDYFAIEEQSSLAGLSIISRLRSVEITLLSYNDEDIVFVTPNMRKILQALPENGYLNAMLYCQGTKSRMEVDM